MNSDHNTFDVAKFEKARSCFLQFEISTDAVTCNGNRGGLQALLNAIDTISNEEGRYELPQWPYEQWKWHTPSISCLKAHAAQDPIPYSASFPSYKNRNIVAKKVFVHIGRQYEGLHFQVYKDKENIYIHLNELGLTQFRKLLYTSMHHCNLFFVAKPSPLYPPTLLSFPKIRLTGTWEDGSCDLMEFVCLEPDTQPWVYLEVDHIEANCSGFLWLMENIISFSQNPEQIINLEIPRKPKLECEPDYWFTTDQAQYEKILIDSKNVKTTFISFNSDSDSKYEHVQVKYYQPPRYLRLIKYNTLPNHVVVIFTVEDDTGIFKANSLGWEYLLAYFNRHLYSMCIHESMYLFDKKTVEEYIAQPSTQLREYPVQGPHGGLEYDPRFMMPTHDEYEPITGIFVERTTVPSNKYISTKILLQLPQALLKE